MVPKEQDINTNNKPPVHKANLWISLMTHLLVVIFIVFMGINLGWKGELDLLRFGMAAIMGYYYSFIPIMLIIHHLKK